MASTLMGIGSLRANLTNPQRAFLWEVRIPHPMGGSATLPAVITVRATSTSIPARSNSPIDIPYKQTAGMRIYGKDKLTHEWKVSFQEGEDVAIYTMIRKWQDIMIDARTGTGTVGAQSYQSDVFCALLDVSGNDTLVVKWKDSWISNVGEPALSYQDSAIVKYDVTFSFNSFETNVD
jgi:hypothetical protein